jgi:hypothetical protein
MSPTDFLRKEAETPLCEYFIAAGAVCSFSTNCEHLLEAAHESFVPAGLQPKDVDFSIRFWVDRADAAQPPWPKPYVRGLGHLVFGGFDAGSSMLADLRGRRVIGRFSQAMAADLTYWKRVIFPMLLSVVAGSVGFVELHASCVARDQRGLILMGPSRSGKSTLAMALTEAGFQFLSDDRTFCSLKQGQLRAWALPRPLKLRSDAGEWFEEFTDREPSDIQNGELVFHCDPNERFGRPSIAKCEPRLLVVLERESSDGFCLTRMTRSEVRSRIEMDLMAEEPDAVRRQQEGIDGLLELPGWRLQYGGRPEVVAAQLARHC